MRFRNVVRSCVAGVLWVAFPQHPAAGPKPETELEQVLYDMGVVGYCGLSTEAVSRGFRRELDRIIHRDEIDRQDFDLARARALTMVEWEWDNRGLGGFRGWCRTEGEAAVDRFLAAPE